MKVRDLENIVYENQLIILEVKKLYVHFASIESKVEKYEIYFNKVLEDYPYYDVTCITTTFDGDLTLKIKDFRL